MCVCVCVCMCVCVCVCGRECVLYDCRPKLDISFFFSFFFFPSMKRDLNMH